MNKNISENDERYIIYDPYAGDRDEDIRNRTVKVVTTRAPHFCSMCEVEHPAKTRMRCETAVVDGEWASSYVCIEAIEKDLKEWRE